MEEKKEGKWEGEEERVEEGKKMKKYNRENNQFQELHNLYNA